MLRKFLAAAALAALAIAFSPPAARADDTFRLDLRGGAGAMTLGLDPDDDADTLAVHRFYGGYRGGFYRPYYGGFSRGFYGFGYRSFYPRFYANYGFGFYRPYSFNFGFSYYRPFSYGYSYYAPSYYYAPYYSYSSFYSPYSYYCPIGDYSPVMPYATAIYSQPSLTVLRVAPADNTPYPMPYSNGRTPNGTYPAPAPNGTYPYDGGPQNPVPMPGANPAQQGTPQSVPRPTVPLEGRAVSLPRQQSQYTYPAYGEGPTQFAADRVAPPRSTPVQTAGR